MLNYITSVIRVEPVNTSKSHFVGLQTLVAKACDIYFSVENPDQLMLSKGKIVLDEAYAKYIYKHSVPLDLDLVHCLKRNPLALDFYRFLAYRNNNLNRTISFPDHLLFEQLGTEQQNDRVIRARLKDIFMLFNIIGLFRLNLKMVFFQNYIFLLIHDTDFYFKKM